MKPLTYLNITQFLGSFNDNLFKFGLAFFLIELQGKESTHLILSLSSALFVLPFILFGAPSGQLADKFSKSRLIVFTKFLELVVMFLACISIYMHLVTASFFLLFLLATQSALFGPSKYGIIPEIVPMDEVSKANGVITSSTFLAIIAGSGAASFILDYTGNNTMLLMLATLVVAILGIASSLLIPYTKPAKKDAPFDAYFWKGAFRAIKEMGSSKNSLLTVALASVYFLFIASYMQLNMIPFAQDVLHLSILSGGYLVFLTSLGIAAGAFTIGYISQGQVRIDLVPYACFFLGIVFILLDLFSSHLWVTLLLLPLAGFFGGVYQVPLDAYLQVFSPLEKRGIYIGTTSLLSFIGVLVASIVFYFIKEAGLPADQGFTWMGVLSCILSLILKMRMPARV